MAQRVESKRIPGENHPGRLTDNGQLKPQLAAQRGSQDSIRCIGQARSGPELSFFRCIQACPPNINKACPA